LGYQLRKRNNNAVPRCHRLRTGIGPGVSSTGENVGTRASRCFRNHCWNGLRRLRHSRILLVQKVQASPQRDLAIHWIRKRGHPLTQILSKLAGALGCRTVRRGLQEACHGERGPSMPLRLNLISSSLRQASDSPPCRRSSNPRHICALATCPAFLRLRRRTRTSVRAEPRSDRRRTAATATFPAR
jgi:hypothetical protein